MLSFNDFFFIFSCMWMKCVWVTRKKLSEIAFEKIMFRVWEEEMKLDEEKVRECKVQRMVDSNERI